jgi:hypothetical protein
MNRNNTLNFTRCALLFKQNVAHNHRLILTSLIGFCGGVFMLLLIIQFTEGFQPVLLKKYYGMFLIVFFTTAIICAGTAFPAFRSKDRSFNYLMNPASLFEKFLWEFVGRILVFMVIVPVLYWAVYNLEGSVVQMFSPAFTFESQLSYFPPSDIHIGPERIECIYALMISCSLLMFTIPFAGAATFDKNPLIKTLFSVAAIFFFNLFLVYFFLNILELRQYHQRSNRILFMANAGDVIITTLIVTILMNAAFISVAFFKLKEKEV